MTSEASPWELTPKGLTSFVSTHLRHGDHFADEVAQVLRNLVLYITKQASYSIARTSVVRNYGSPKCNDPGSHIH